MKNTHRRRKPISAEAIARLAHEGQDVSRFFSNAGRMMGPIQRVNVDLTLGMLEELDTAAKELNISRQAVIKTLIRQALDQQYLARARRTSMRQLRMQRTATRFASHAATPLPRSSTAKPRAK